MSRHAASRLSRRRAWPRPTGRIAWLLAAGLVVALACGVAAIVLAVGGGSTGSAAVGATLPTGSSGSPAGTAAPAAFRDPAAVAAVLADAVSDVETVDSYDYRSLDAARRAAAGVTAGSFATDYLRSLAGPVGQAVRTRHLAQQASADRVGVLSLDGDTASALVVGTLLSHSRSDPAGHSTRVTLVVGLRQTGGRWRITSMSDITDRGIATATPPGDAGLVEAVTAAGRSVVELLSYSRADFDADFARSLTGLTSSLQAGQLRRRDALLAHLQQAGVDAAGQVRAIAVESASGDDVSLLVCLTADEIHPDGSTVDVGSADYEVHVVRRAGAWLVDAFVPLRTG